MAEIAVVNASPLIFLSKAGHLELLHSIADRILVPEPVAEEIMVRGVSDAAANAINEREWIEIMPVPVVPEIIQLWGLGPGESSVLALAQQYPGSDVIIDDLAGRKCASALGIPLRGTLGIVLTAKRRGIIPSARAVMEDLMRIGLYLSRPTLESALSRVDE